MRLCASSAVDIMNQSTTASGFDGAVTCSTVTPSAASASSVRSYAASITGSTSARNVRHASTRVGGLGSICTVPAGSDTQSPGAAPKVARAWTTTSATVVAVAPWVENSI